MTQRPFGTIPNRRWLDEHEFGGDLLFGLVSDTHIPEARATLFDEVYAAFRGVDLILHGGDMHDIVVLDWLEEIAPVLGVCGNGDDGSSGRMIAPDDERLPYNQLLHVNGLKVGMTHDFPDRPYARTATLEERMDRHFGGPVDIVVAGDTHVPVVTKWGRRADRQLGIADLPAQPQHTAGHDRVHAVPRPRGRRLDRAAALARRSGLAGPPDRSSDEGLTTLGGLTGNPAFPAVV